MTDESDQSGTPRGALHGLKVVDLSRVLAGPYCTQILGDHGADVLKVEAPQGDETRRWGPPFVDGSAAYFMGVNRNKRGMVLDFTQDAARTTLAGLLKGADVLVENFKAGTLERWGFGRDVLEKDYPGLVHCRITGFGDDGPYGGLPGYDAALQAMTGLMSINGEPDAEPLRAGVPVVDLVTGLNAVIGILVKVAWGNWLTCPCSTAVCRFCILILPTFWPPATCRSEPATLIPTLRPMIPLIRRPARFSWQLARTGSSPVCVT
jgi:crotonobetainyl-CoA:carnitine CoA-transferase CaiB-like acyl-CoA transferase